MKTDFEKLLEKVAVPVSRSAGLNWKRFINFSDRMFRARFLKLTSLIILTLIVFIFIVGFGNNEAIKIQTSVGKSSDNELIKKVSGLVVLPDEKPVIATVADYKKLEGNLFFKEADNGDKLLLFQKSDKAVLYDPNENIIINFGKVEEVGVNLNF